MLNDEINITSGLQELIHTDMPEESETDYTKADKTDRRINQTYLIVDKQNQEIESVISNVSEQNDKINQITQTVDELNSKISDIADITVSQETNNATLTFTGINESEPIRVEIHPITTNISYLYPRENLYPSDTLYLQNRTLRFTNTDTSAVVDYELPMDLLYYDSNNYDEFILDYDSQTCIVNKKVGYNADGTTYVLANPETIPITPYPTINLTAGDYTIELLGYSIGYMMIRLMSQNIYTTQFATKAELSSSITQTRDAIELEVSEKLDEEDFTSANILLKINNDTSSATIKADKINLNGVVTANDNFKILSDGSMEAINGQFTGGKIILTDNNTSSSYSQFTVKTNSNSYWTVIKPHWIIMSGESSNGSINIFNENDYKRISISSGSGNSQRAISHEINTNNVAISEWRKGDGGQGTITTTITPDGIVTPSVTQTSKEEDKKNFEKLDKGLDIIKDIDIYKYNMKTEKDDIKKHIGFVIGDDFKYRQEVTSKNNDGVDVYSFVSVCCKAIQEQQEQIEELKEQIKKLGGK